MKFSKKRGLDLWWRTIAVRVDNVSYSNRASWLVQLSKTYKSHECWPTLYWWTNQSNGCCWTMPVKIHFARKGFSICFKTWNTHWSKNWRVKQNTMGLYSLHFPVCVVFTVHVCVRGGIDSLFVQRSTVTFASLFNFAPKQSLKETRMEIGSPKNGTIGTCLYLSMKHKVNCVFSFCLFLFLYFVKPLN